MSQGEPEQTPLAAEQLRARLVQQLVAGRAIRSPNIAQAFAEVPRELFLPPEIPLEKVYSDDAIVVKWNESRAATSSSTQPYLMADMLEALDLAPGQKVLEIGAGVGYNAAILIHVLGDGGLLTSVDLDPAMAETARQNLIKLGSPYDRATVIAADGSLGYPPNAPYDRIIVTVQQWEISPDWVDQLKVGGILILPLSISMHIWGGLIPALRKEADGTLRAVGASHGGFMPMRGQMAHPRAQQDDSGGTQRQNIASLKILPSEVLPGGSEENEFPLMVSLSGLPLPVAEKLVKNPDQLHYIPNGTVEFEVGDLPPANLKWNDMNANQRRASRTYYGYTSLLSIANEDQLSTLLATAPAPAPEETDQGNEEAPRSVLEPRGLALAMPLPGEQSFDLALLVAGTAYGWRVTLDQNESGNSENLALAKLNEVWQTWESLNQPMPSEYRPAAYPSSQPPPGPGYVIHRKYYNFLIPIEP